MKILCSGDPFAALITASRTALIGGGTRPKPGEISLAHLGVLFLDEIPEYPRSNLEALRQPLEDKSVTISRVNGYSSYPADFMLVATMNPCPCGFFGDPTKECTCSNSQILAYQKKLSGPLLDRIDMVVSVSRVANDKLLDTKSLSSKQHAAALELIKTAGKRQTLRDSDSKIDNDTLTPEARELLKAATDRLSLSARSYFKVIKVARTIAHLDDSDSIESRHIAEALQYRRELLNSGQ